MTDRLVIRACTHKSRLSGNRWLPQTTSAAVATSREGQRKPRSGREGQHRRWGQETAAGQRATAAR
jgi:hypothetical protein